MNISAAHLQPLTNQSWIRKDLKDRKPKLCPINHWKGWFCVCGAGHMRQLLRQSDTVSKPNNVLSVPFQLNVGTKLFFLLRGAQLQLLVFYCARMLLIRCRNVALSLVAIVARRASFVCLYLGLPHWHRIGRRRTVRHRNISTCKTIKQ